MGDLLKKATSHLHFVQRTIPSAAQISVLAKKSRFARNFDRPGIV